MKKLFLILTIFLACSISAFAAETDNSYSQKIDEIAKENNIDFEKIKENPLKVLEDVVKDTIKEFSFSHLNEFAKIAAVLILTSLINFFVTQQNVQISKLINIVSVLVIFSNTFDSFLKMTEDIETVFFEIKNFMVSFLPVFAGVSFASGEMVTSTVYTGFFLICVVTVANFCIDYIIPSLNIFLSVGITSSLSSVIKLKPLCKLYSKTVRVAMTVAVSIMCFVLSLQTTISQGQDTLAVKTGKMIVTSAVPVIGSTLQGAIGSIYASMGVLKGFCGIVGIVAISAMFLPQILNLAIQWLGYCLLNMLAEVMENNIAAEILEIHKDVVEILISMSVLFMVLLLFSVSIMIKMFEGV